MLGPGWSSHVPGDAGAQAATTVGYRSTAHFSRDYRHLYGASPAADATRLRAKLRHGGLGDH